MKKKRSIKRIPRYAGGMSTKDKVGLGLALGAVGTGIAAPIVGPSVVEGIRDIYNGGFGLEKVNLDAFRNNPDLVATRDYLDLQDQDRGLNALKAHYPKAYEGERRLQYIDRRGVSGTRSLAGNDKAINNSYRYTSNLLGPAHHGGAHPDNPNLIARTPTWTTRRSNAGMYTIDPDSYISNGWGIKPGSFLDKRIKPTSENKALMKERSVLKKELTEIVPQEDDYIREKYDNFNRGRLRQIDPNLNYDELYIPEDFKPKNITTAPGLAERHRYFNENPLGTTPPPPPPEPAPFKYNPALEGQPTELHWYDSQLEAQNRPRFRSTNQPTLLDTEDNMRIVGGGQQRRPPEDDPAFMQPHIPGRGNSSVYGPLNQFDTRERELRQLFAQRENHIAQNRKGLPDHPSFDGPRAVLDEQMRDTVIRPSLTLAADRTMNRQNEMRDSLNQTAQMLANRTGRNWVPIDKTSTTQRIKDTFRANAERISRGQPVDMYGINTWNENSLTPLKQRAVPITPRTIADENQEWRKAKSGDTAYGPGGRKVYTQSYNPDEEFGLRKDLVNKRQKHHPVRVPLGYQRAPNTIAPNTPALNPQSPFRVPGEDSTMIFNNEPASAVKANRVAQTKRAIQASYGPDHELDETQWAQPGDMFGSGPQHTLPPERFPRLMSPQSNDSTRIPFRGPDTREGRRRIALQVQQGNTFDLSENYPGYQHHEVARAPGGARGEQGGFVLQAARNRRTGKLDYAFTPALSAHHRQFNPRGRVFSTTTYKGEQPIPYRPDEYDPNMHIRKSVLNKATGESMTREESMRWLHPEQFQEPSEEYSDSSEMNNGGRVVRYSKGGSNDMLPLAMMGIGGAYLLSNFSDAGGSIIGPKVSQAQQIKNIRAGLTPGGNKYDTSAPFRLTGPSGGGGGYAVNQQGPFAGMQLNTPQQASRRMFGPPGRAPYAHEYPAFGDRRMFREMFINTNAARYAEDGGIIPRYEDGVKMLKKPIVKSVYA